MSKLCLNTESVEILAKIRTFNYKYTISDCSDMSEDSRITLTNRRERYLKMVVPILTHESMSSVYKDIYLRAYSSYAKYSKIQIVAI